MMTIKDTINTGSTSVSSSVVSHTSTVSPQLNSLSYLSNIDTNVLAILNLLKVSRESTQGQASDVETQSILYNTTTNPGTKL